MKTYDSKAVQKKPPSDPIYKVRNDILKCLEWWIHLERTTSYGAVLHRERGPAVMFDDGSREWYFHGDLHRTDGPAVIDALDGEFMWCIRGKYIADYDDFQFLTGCSDEDIVFFKIRYGKMT